MDRLFNVSDKPIIIAGPCSAESLHQLQSVSYHLQSDSRVAMMRIGVWKPRTRPGGFEGMGEPALEWADKVHSLYPGLPICCEVARPEHIELCLQHSIDAVWIGARTTVNPFLVGELAETLRGTTLGVLVKNPITPDVDLWMGAIERLLKAGIVDIAAVHRGFSTYNNFGYRNNPLWEIPIELRRRMPQLPLLCDPSHIAGRRDLVAPVAQMSLDLHFDGLMVECHDDPDSALTDSQQQLSLTDFTALLNNLKVRQFSDTAPSDLQRMREQLDIIDTQILKLLSQRMKISKDIGAIKHAHNMPIYQPSRWQQVLDRQIQNAKQMGLDEQFVKDITEKIHAESLRMQK